MASRTAGQGARATLYDTVALAPDNIWAVGSASLLDSRYEVPLIMRWNGISWNVLPTPTIAGDTVRLYSVAAIGSNDIWAVGAASTSGSSATVTLHWNGADWSRIASPNGRQDSTFSALYDIDALATNDIWAVGDDGGQPIIVHWNGATWAKVANPAGLDQNAHWLRGVTVVAANDAWAVGEHATGSATTMIMHWDGTAWSLVPSPNVPQGGNNELYGVDALAANDIWAVGAGFYQPLALHWDGQQWNIQAFPVQPPGDYLLNDLIAVAPNNIWAVGKNTAQAITFHWDGNSWHDASPASRILATESLYGVTAVNASDIWAVGHVNIGSGDGPMLVRRFAPSVALAGSSFRRSTSPTVDIPVTVSSTAPYTVSVHYATSSGSALAGVDYDDTAGTIQIPPCETTASFPVTLIDSPTWKPAAYANLTLANPLGASLGTFANAHLFTANIAQAPAGLAVFLPIARTPAPPQSTRIAYVGISQNQSIWHIFTMNADGSERRQLTNSSGRDYDPSWSPDGQRIAFVSERDGNPEIYVMNADGSGQTRLTVSPGGDTTPAWSPDGRRIAFSSQRKGSRLLFVMQSDGRAQTQLTFSTSSIPPNDLAPTWSPDSQQIAFTSMRGSSTYAEIYTINANGTGLRRLTNTLEEDTDPVWSPDGQTIAYASGYYPRYQLMSMHADGSQQHLLNQNFDTGGHPSWSPDGRSVAYDSLAYHLGITGVTHAAPQDIASQAYREIGPVWAPR